MSNSCTVRPATPKDAASAVALLRDSITHLCIPDHQNDPATLERWLRNKTTDHFERSTANPQIFMVVAEIESVLCGVGSLRSSGDLELCYVLPGRQRTGIGETPR